MRLHLVDWLHLLAINFTATFRTEGGAKKREGGREEREGGRERQEETTQETFHNSILDKSHYEIHAGIPPNDKIPFHIFYQMS